MPINPVNTDNLTLLQEMYHKFWTKFNYVSSCNDAFVKEFKVHKIASIRYYQDYAVGAPYIICIKINFNKEQASIQAYFNNLTAFDEFFGQHRDKIELKLGKRLLWKKMKTKAYALYTLNLPYMISDMSNWDKVCEEIIHNAILVKKIFCHYL